MKVGLKPLPDLRSGVPIANTSLSSGVVLNFFVLIKFKKLVKLFNIMFYFYTTTLTSPVTVE